MVGSLSRLHAELMTKTLFRLFLLWLLADQKARSLTAEKTVLFEGCFLGGGGGGGTLLYSTSGKIKKKGDAVLYVRGKFILVRNQ